MLLAASGTRAAAPRMTLLASPSYFTVLFHPKKNRLSVLKRCVPKTLAFAFGLRLRSKTRCFKTRVLGRRLANGKPQERCDLGTCVLKR